MLFLSCTTISVAQDDVYSSPKDKKHNSTSIRKGNIMLYDGPTRQKDEVALILKGAHYEFLSGTYINGKMTEYIPELGFGEIQRTSGFYHLSIMNPLTEKYYTIKFKTIEVLPRQVKVSVGIYYLAFMQRQLRSDVIQFNAEAGHEYRMNGFSGVNPGAWVVDLNTNTIVGKVGNIPNAVLMVK
jgi:hypothetical protein